MAALVGLFDPTTSDEPIEDLDDLLSASAMLEAAGPSRTGSQRKPAANGNGITIRAGLPPRSKTALDLSAQFRASSAEMANQVNNLKSYCSSKISI